MVESRVPRPAWRRGVPRLAWRLAALGVLLLASALVSQPAAAEVDIANTYWEATIQDVQDPNFERGRWSARTGPGYGSAGENLKLVMWDFFSYLSVKSEDTLTVYSNQPAAPNLFAHTTVDLNGFASVTTSTATSAQTTWQDVGTGLDDLEVRQNLTVGGWDITHHFLRYEATVCNRSAHPARISIRANWDVMSQKDGAGSRKAWASPGFTLGPFDNVMEAKDDPTEAGLAFGTSGSSLVYFMTLNDDPAFSWLPSPPTRPDRFHYWDFDEIQTSWRLTGSPGSDAYDGAVTYFWGYHTPYQLAASGPDACISVVTYFLPLPDVTPPQARAAADSSRQGCEDSRLHFQDLSVPSPETTVVSRRWDFGDGAWSTARDPVHGYAEPGVYNVTLTVTDSNGLKDTVRLQVVSVGDPNCCPTLRSSSFASVWEGETVSFRMEAVDFEGDPLLYHSEGAPPGSRVEGTAFQWHTQPGDAGNYAFRLIATDGCAAVQDVEVRVLASPPPGTQRDIDQDGVGDRADNCPGAPNVGQEDADRDGSGDACDTEGPAPVAPQETSRRAHGLAPDQDQDGVQDRADNCPATPNVGQEDLDLDAFGDACDADADGDGFVDAQGCEAPRPGCGKAAQRTRERPEQRPTVAGLPSFLPDGPLAGMLLFLAIVALVLAAVLRRERA